MSRRRGVREASFNAEHREYIRGYTVYYVQVAMLHTAPMQWDGVL